jgi:hypothetical protein
MTKTEAAALIVRLTVEHTESKAALRAANTQANRQAVVDTSAVLSKAIMEHCPPKARGYGCRAGKRQWNERNAERLSRWR